MEAKAATVSPAEQNPNPIFWPTLSEIFVAVTAAEQSPTAVTGTEVRFGGQQKQYQARTDCFNRTKFGQCFRPWRTT